MPSCAPLLLSAAARSAITYFQPAERLAGQTTTGADTTILCCETANVDTEDVHTLSSTGVPKPEDWHVVPVRCQSSRQCKTRSFSD